MDQAFTVRQMQDSKRGFVFKAPKFVVINMNVIEDGQIVDIMTVVFKGLIPSPNDFRCDMLIVGEWSDHPKHGLQFSVTGWNAGATSPTARHNARKLSPSEVSQLTGK